MDKKSKILIIIIIILVAFSFLYTMGYVIYNDKKKCNCNVDNNSPIVENKNIDNETLFELLSIIGIDKEKLNTPSDYECYEQVVNSISGNVKEASKLTIAYLLIKDMISLQDTSICYTEEFEAPAGYCVAFSKSNLKEKLKHFDSSYNDIEDIMGEFSSDYYKIQSDNNFYYLVSDWGCTSAITKYDISSWYGNVNDKDNNIEDQTFVTIHTDLTHNEAVHHSFDYLFEKIDNIYKLIKVQQIQ